MKVGAARQQAGRSASLVKVTLPDGNSSDSTLQFVLHRHQLRKARRREGRYLLRTNLGTQGPSRN